MSDPSSSWRRRYTPTTTLRRGTTPAGRVPSAELRGRVMWRCAPRPMLRLVGEEIEMTRENFEALGYNLVERVVGE